VGAAVIWKGYLGMQNYSNLIFIAVVFAAMYFLLIRPQQQRAKAQAEMISKLEPGTEIVTIGGIYGTLVDVGEDRLRMRVADGSEIEIARRAVGSIVPPTEIEELEALEAEGSESETDESGDDA
jgi:preprotein translocase subunit YajC